MNLKKEEIIIGGLTAFSLSLMASYILLRLYILKKPTVFLQTPLNCQNLSCQECDTNGDTIFNNLDVLSLSFQLKQAGCNQGQINKDLGYCFANCSQKKEPLKRDYSCQTKIFKDSNCQNEDWEFEFQAANNRSQNCQKYNGGSKLTSCRKNH